MPIVRSVFTNREKNLTKKLLIFITFIKEKHQNIGKKKDNGSYTNVIVLYK